MKFQYKSSVNRREYAKRYYLAHRSLVAVKKKPGPRGPHAAESVEALMLLGRKIAGRIGFNKTCREIFDAMPGQFQTPRQLEFFALVTLGKLVSRLQKAVGERAL